MGASPTIVFDLDGTLVDTAPDLVATLNAVFVSEALQAVSFDTVRTRGGRGARGMIEKRLIAQGRTLETTDIDRLFANFIAHYAAHIADHSRPYPGLIEALDVLAAQGF